MKKYLGFLVAVAMMSVTALAVDTTAFRDVNVKNTLKIGSTATIDASAVVDVFSTTKGILLPRMTTTQQNAIATPHEGLYIYDTVLHAPAIYNGTSWLSTLNFSSFVGTATIAQGGTGQTTQQAAFDALSPCSSAGCTIAYSSGHNVALNTSFSDLGKAFVSGGGSFGPNIWQVLGVIGGGTGLSSATLGDLHYGSATSVLSILSGNTTTTKKVLTQTGTGSVSAAPAWGVLACGDLSNSVASCSTDTTNAANVSTGTLSSARLPSPTASTLGGVESLAAVSHNFITSISTSGVPAQAQPAFSDISGTASLTSQVTGVLPIANGGTNNGSLTVTAGQMYIADGTKLIPISAPGSSGQCLVSTSTTAVGWGSCGGGGGAHATGEVYEYAGTSCPSLSMQADGSSQLRTGGTGCGGGSCANLFTAIGTTYGSVDGTHFTLPNAEGVFVVGAGSQTISTISYTGTQGTTQGDQFQGHFHSITDPGHSHAAAGGAGGSTLPWTSAGTTAFCALSSTGVTFHSTFTAGGQAIQASTTGITVGAATSDGTNGTPRTGTQTRPANISFIRCIVY